MNSEIAIQHLISWNLTLENCNTLIMHKKYCKKVKKLTTAGPGASYSFLLEDMGNFIEEVKLYLYFKEISSRFDEFGHCMTT